MDTLGTLPGGWTDGYIIEAIIPGYHRIMLWPRNQQLLARLSLVLRARLPVPLLHHQYMMPHAAEKKA